LIEIQAMKKGDIFYNFVLFSPDPFVLYCRVKSMLGSLKGISFEGRINFPEVCFRVFPENRIASREGVRSLEKAKETLRKNFGKNIVSEDGTTLPLRFLRELFTRRLKFACAESCTGGAIANLITSIPGSSSVFVTSIVSYSNESKENLLGVDPVTIRKYGAVSSEVVHQMLNGIIKKTGVDCAVATSGIAGPEGGSKEKGVGVVYVGAVAPEKKLVKRFEIKGMERNDFRVLVASVSLKFLLEILEGACYKSKNKGKL